MKATQHHPSLAVTLQEEMHSIMGVRAMLAGVAALTDAESGSEEAMSANMLVRIALEQLDSIYNSLDRREVDARPH